MLIVGLFVDVKVVKKRPHVLPNSSNAAAGAEHVPVTSVEQLTYMLQAGHTIARAVRILRCSFLAPAVFAVSGRNDSGVSLRLRFVGQVDRRR